MCRDGHLRRPRLGEQGVPGVMSVEDILSEQCKKSRTRMKQSKVEELGARESRPVSPGSVSVAQLY